MKRDEFLSQLHKALENELSGQAVNENVQYYRTYIEGEVRTGRREEDVLEELGDPWLIARTIIDSPNAGQSYTSAEDSYVRERNQGNDNRVHVFGLDTWWKKLLLVLAVFGIIAIVISIIMGILSIVLPIAVPVLVVIFVVKMFSKK